MIPLRRTCGNSIASVQQSCLVLPCQTARMKLVLVKNYRLAKQIYAAEGSDEGSVPVLYDKKIGRIVKNESVGIARTLNDRAGALGSSHSDADRPDLHLTERALRDEIDTLNNPIYTNINNGADKAGFSSDQAVYEAAFQAYFNVLSELETQLASDGRPVLTGDMFI